MSTDAATAPARPDEFAFRPVDPQADAVLLHGWVTHPKAAFWLMQDATVDRVRAQYTGLDAWIGSFRGGPAVLLERYDPAATEVAAVHRTAEGDVGIHFLTAPGERPVPGFTRAGLTAVLRRLFADPAVRRVVVEPDVRNRAVHALNAAVGFRPVRAVTLPRSGKRALLSTCTREQFRAATGEREHEPLAHLTPQLWARANRQLVRKALAEFAHERLITPAPLPESGGWYGVASDDDAVAYRFRAELLALDHWRIEANSILRLRASDGVELPLDAGALVLELRRSLALSDEVLPLYLEEITGTLAATAFKLSLPEVPAAELAAADFQSVEAAMTEGHPCFVANSGRLGFDAVDQLRYAPEAGAPVRLLWVAVHPDRAVRAFGRDVDIAQLGAPELPAELARYVPIPVHPWQWEHRLSVSYADEIARGRIVLLGEGRESHLAQQSIRTFFNAAAPDRPYVKTALSVLNMGFTRGLSADYMEHTPAVNDWLADLVAADATLTGCGFSILREHAAAGYRHPHYPTGTPQQKQLAALWRESPVPLLHEGERTMTMAALLHTDRDGASLAAALIAASGLAAEEWLRRYLTAYLTPVVHALCAYGLTFMPHGENVILVLDRDGAPLRVFFKDIAEEVAVLDPATPLPPQAARIRAEVPPQLWALSLHTDVLDCFLRFLSAELHVGGTVPQDAFWAVVARVLRDYEAAHPELAERFTALDLFAERFALSCLNRLQLRDNRQMVDLADPAGALQFAGTLPNPLSGR